MTALDRFDCTFQFELETGKSSYEIHLNNLIKLISESVDKDSATEIRQFIDDIGGFPVLESSWIDSTFDLEESVARARRYITNNVWPIPSGTLIGLNILNDYKVYGKHVLYVSTKYRILGERLQISSMPGKALRTLNESRGFPSDSTCLL